MGRSLIAIILIIASVLGFVLFVGPQYQDVVALRTEESQLKDVLANSRTLQQKRDQLLKTYNEMSPADVARLEKMVPNNADNVKLILELQTLASKYGLELRTAALSEEEEMDRTQRTQVQIATRDYGTISLDLVVRGSYEGFVGFISDVEKSLRIIDVESLAFRSEANNPSVFQFNISLNTYWLKQIN
jgi:Tfp pilus assembly protein PilO